MVNQNPYNPYGQNPLIQQQVPKKTFSIPSWIFWFGLIGILGIAVWLIFF